MANPVKKSKWESLDRINRIKKDSKTQNIVIPAHAGIPVKKNLFNHEGHEEHEEKIRREG